MDITAPPPHAITINAGKISFATDPGAVADVECVIPNVEFPRIARINRRDEINQIVCYDNNKFVATNSVRGWQHVGKVTTKMRELDWDTYLDKVKGA